MKSGLCEKNLMKKFEKGKKIPCATVAQGVIRGVRSLTQEVRYRGDKQCPSVLGWTRCSA